MKVGSTLRTVVPFFPAREEFLVLRPQLEKALNVVGNSGRWILGRQVEIFEKELGRLIGVKYVVSCASGTDAITLTLMAWGLGVGAVGWRQRDVPLSWLTSIRPRGV